MTSVARVIVWRVMVRVTPFDDGWSLRFHSLSFHQGDISVLFVDAPSTNSTYMSPEIINNHVI